MEALTIQPDAKQDENNIRFLILNYKVNEIEIEKIWKNFREAGFDPILIKGWAASKLYPEPFRRQFSDVDLMIAPERFEEALTFSKNLNLRLPVDLHEGARHLDSFDFADLFLNSVEEMCNKTPIRVLRPEDHLRILCIHWLTDGGAYRDRLWDIYYAVANRSENFDWDRLLEGISARRRRWVVCTIGLAHKYLDLDIEDTPIVSEAKNLPRWLTRTIEKEWASDVKMMPLEMFWSDRKMLWKQIKKRFPPNPIHAVVLEKGDFDGKIRFGYQIKNAFRRLLPSIRKAGGRLFFRKRNL